MSYINMNSVFASLDKRKAEAEAFIASFTKEQITEASRVASLYSNNAGSIRHAEKMVDYLKLVSQ